MEDYHPIYKICCKFNSDTLNYLNVIISDPQGHPITHILMLENRKYQIEPNHPLPYCYLTAFPPRRQQDYTLQIAYREGQNQSTLEKEHEFEQFTLSLQLKTITDRYQNDVVQVSKMREETTSLAVAQTYLTKVKQKVILALTKQNFIKSNKRKSRIVPKTKLRRSKTKKNLTAIYCRNTSNELIVKTFKKQVQKSQINLTPQEQQQNNAFANSQVMANSKSCFGMQNSRNSQTSKSHLIEQDQNKQEEKQQEEQRLSDTKEERKGWCVRYCTGKLKNRYLKTLERETVHNLQVQKEQLDFLKTITAKENLHKDNQPVVIHKDKQPVIKIHGPQQDRRDNRKSELVSAYRIHSPSKLYKLRLAK